MKDDISNMDDTRLLMQYFRKHDTDNNHRLDGLELLKAIANMEEDHKHDDEDEDDADHDLASDEHHPGDGPMKVDLEQIIPIVDSILEQDDKVFVYFYFPDLCYDQVSSFSRTRMDISTMPSSCLARSSTCGPSRGLTPRWRWRRRCPRCRA